MHISMLKENAFVYDIFNTTVGGYIGGTYCGTLVDNIKYSPIIFLEK